MSFCPYYLLGLSPDCQVCSCLTYTEYFSTKEGDKPELCISYKQQFTHSFKSTSVVLDPHPVSWPCPPWIWLLSLYYPISGLYPKIFFMCACLMRFVCQGLGRAAGLEGWTMWGATRNFPHTWCQAHHLSGSISKWKKRRKKKGGGKSLQGSCAPAAHENHRTEIHLEDRGAKWRLRAFGMPVLKQDKMFH